MDDPARTLWCGNLSDKVTEELLYELFLQVAPLEKVRIPTDKSGRKSSYGFVTLKHECSLSYAVQLLDGTILYDRRMKIQPRTQSQNTGPAENQRNPYDRNLPHYYNRDNREYNRDRGYRPYQRRDNRQNWGNNYKNKRRY